REGEAVGLAEHFEHRWRPVSAGVAVPIFALFAAGVAFGGLSGLVEALTDPVALGIVAGLVLGKGFGIFGTTYLMGRFTKAELDRDIGWVDVLGLSLLAGIGFTVSLLVGDLAFGTGGDRDELVKIAVLCGSLLAALLATVILRLRNRVYRRIHEEENRDEDRDGIPDVYQQPSPADGGPGRPESP
ncbi:Na+/H+ antiporter NhaA, partial [Saccharomonospora halophila]|uniref:Na+/H+ antiporter NhaA n=1 Tax=Saccharomonospora halophila TaxID=129922 RepID=UPI000381281A